MRRYIVEMSLQAVRPEGEQTVRSYEDLQHDLHRDTRFSYDMRWSLRRISAVWAAKITEKISIHIFRRQGAAWAGKIALKICPSILHELAGQVGRGIFAVCGTNGKTTVNNLLCAAIEAEGYRVVCNHTGSNMLNGIASAFAACAGLDGNLKADYACIEIDEASAGRVIRHFRPDYMVLTNLFRDQLDRYGEIDTAMKILGRVMRQAPEMKVVVNGDEPLSAFLAMDSGNPYITYGIHDPVRACDHSREIREGRFCRRCGTGLDYHFYHYSQLGDYYCPKCGFQRPGLQFNACDIEFGKELTFTVEDKRIHSAHKGFYNIYNILAAYAALRTAGLGGKHFARVAGSYEPENGRMEEFWIGGVRVMLNLAKNPAGFNQNIDVVMQDENIKDLLIVINDNDQDGRDISWLWDVDFERLKRTATGSVMVSGLRCSDMMLRMKYAGIDSEIEADVRKAVKRSVREGCGNLYVLVNYTALYDIRNILRNCR